MRTVYTRWRSPGWLTALVLAVFACAPGAASADTFTFDLGTGNSAISGYTGPYEQVTVNRTDSTHATITFTSLTKNGYIFLMGDGGTVGLNVNATSFSASNIKGTNPNSTFQAWSLVSTDSGNEDGFGKFNLTVNSFDGFAHAINQMTLNLTDNSGTWATATDVLTANANGAIAGAHVYVTASPADASNGALVTGYAAGSGGGTTPINTPEPASIALALTGALGFGLAGLRRLRRQKAAA
jgi:hypothetical protein